MRTAALDRRLFACLDSSPLLSHIPQLGTTTKRGIELSPLGGQRWGAQSGLVPYLLYLTLYLDGGCDVLCRTRSWLVGRNWR